MSIHWDPSHHTPYDDIPDPDPRVGRIEEILESAYCDRVEFENLYLLSDVMVEEIRKLATALSDDLILETNRECPGCLQRLDEEYRQENERS